MKNLKKLCEYFAVAFPIVLVCGFIGLVIKEVDRGTFYDLDTSEALVFCLQLGMTTFTALIPYSLSICHFPVFLDNERREMDRFFPCIGNRAASCVTLIGNDLLL